MPLGRISLFESIGDGEATKETERTETPTKAGSFVREKSNAEAGKQNVTSLEGNERDAEHDSYGLNAEVSK